MLLILMVIIVIVIAIVLTVTIIIIVTINFLSFPLNPVVTVLSRNMGNLKPRFIDSTARAC